MSCPRAKQGFTLVETLVVVAIVAILAAIVTVAALNARRQARMTECLSQLKQIEAAIRLYEVDYDDYWPPYPLINSPTDVPGFKSALAAYKLPDSQWYCPLDTKARTKYLSEWGSHEHWSYEMGLGFALRAHVVGNPQGPICRTGLADPAGLYMFTDQNEIVGGSKRLTAHGERMNVIFADGHAKSMPTVNP